MKAFSLAELARLADVSARTVRYYIQRGLLEAPTFRGPDTQYGPEHLAALRAIRALQAAYWPLDAISATLRGKSADELHAIAAGKLPPAAPGTAVATPPVPQRKAARLLRGARIPLTEGLELWLDDSASADVHELAAQIEALVAERTPKRTGGRR